MQYLEHYKTADFWTPSQHVSIAMSACLQAPHWSNDDKLKALGGDVVLPAVFDLTGIGHHCRVCSLVVVVVRCVVVD